MLAYFTIIPAILFLVIEPYNKDKFIRFHSFQSIFFHVATIGVWIIFFVLGAVLGMIPIVGAIIDVLLWVALSLGLLAVWAFMVYKAYNNERFMLPLIGALAEKQVG